MLRWSIFSVPQRVTARSGALNRFSVYRKNFDVSDSGILTTASDLLFTGGREGFFHALDARTGKLLWKASLGGQIVNGPMSYEVDGKQYVAIISGHNLVSFALRD